MNILITSAGRRVSLVNAFKNELGNVFPDGKIFCADLNPELSSACQVVDCAFPVPPVTDYSYIEMLINISIQNSVKIIIPTIDTELPILAKYRSEFLSNGINCLISDPDLVFTFSDKRKTNAFFTSIGIAHPREYHRENIKFPVFIKPNDGSASKDIFVANSEDDIPPRIRNNPDMLFLEHINPAEFSEYTMDLYYSKNSELICIVPRKRIEVRSGEVSKGVTCKNQIIDFIYNRMRKINGLRGCITLQMFLKNTGEKIYGIEINPRFGGGYPLSYLAGANFPKWIIEEYLLGKDLSFFNDWESDLLMLRYDAEVIKHGYKSI